ncbi:MAG: tetratricopeptide repeat protein [Myxococcota bacterium]
MNNNAADFDEARWRRLSDAEASEEQLSDTDRDFLYNFSPRSDAAKAEAQFFAALASLGDSQPGEAQPGDEEPANSPLVHATVQHVLAAQRNEVVADISPPPAKTRRRWAVPGLAAAAAAVALWLGVSTDQATTSDGQAPAMAVNDVEPAAPSTADQAPAPAPTTTAAAVDVAPPQPAAPTHFSVESGSLLDASGATLQANAIVSGSVQVGEQLGCVGFGDSTACFESGARFELSDDSPQTLVVVEGRGVIESPEITVGVMQVEIAGDHYTMSSPVKMHATVHSRKAAKVEIVSGQVEVRDADGQTRTLKAGEIRGRDKVQRPVVVPDAKTLLGRAQASSSAGDRRAAISHYEKLLRHYPDLPMSKAALVPLAEKYLEIGKPGPALRHFERYIRLGGVAAQEAHNGRIRALDALGRKAKKQEAIEAFLERYPSSPYAAKYRASLSK